VDQKCQIIIVFEVNGLLGGGRGKEENIFLKKREEIKNNYNIMVTVKVILFFTL